MLRTIDFLLYKFGVKAYFFLVWILSFLNSRARNLLLGQKGLKTQIMANEKGRNAFNIWFHVSSLGEFEQGKPVMEGLKKRFPNCRLVVTFFSPSGYDLRKNDPLCDAVYYLPFESKSNAVWWVNLVQPKMAFWVKYDFWFEYLHALSENNIPIFLIAARFRPKQIFFKPWAHFHHEILKKFNLIFCQNQLSIKLLQNIGVTPAVFSGDTRFDRVSNTMKDDASIPLITEFKNASFLLIAGSSYKQEEEIIKRFLDQKKLDLKVIIAPHFVNAENIQRIETLFGVNAVCYSKLTSIEDLQKKNVLIIDSIGLLAKLYKYANVAFIGGGFKENGLHNVLEAATFGMPICFGPKIKRFPEAQDLVEAGIGKVIKNQLAFDDWLIEIYTKPDKLNKIANNSREFVNHNLGATKLILEKVDEQIGDNQSFYI